jgi:hypothetical protein
LKTLKRRDYVGDMGADWRILLKSILEECGVSFSELLFRQFPVGHKIIY